MPASPSSTGRAPSVRPSNSSSSHSSSQTSIRRWEEPITNTQSGCGWQNNPNGEGAQKIVNSDVEETPLRPFIPPNLHLSSSWQVRKQINNKNLGSGVQANNNDVGTQVVSQTPGSRQIHRDTLRGSNPSDVGSGRSHNEINNWNSNLGVQTNNDYDGTQYAYAERQDYGHSSAPVSSPSHYWDRQINNYNEGEGSQNNNNDEGTQHVYPPEQHPPVSSTIRRPNPLSSTRRTGHGLGSSRVVENHNSGRGIQNNNNDSGTQSVYRRDRRNAKAAKTVPDRASLRREPPSSTGSSKRITGQNSSKSPSQLVRKTR